jgi:hypothetical protein
MSYQYKREPMTAKEGGDPVSAAVLLFYGSPCVSA